MLEIDAAEDEVINVDGEAGVRAEHVSHSTSSPVGVNFLVSPETWHFSI